MDIFERSAKLHAQHKGKIAIQLRDIPNTPEKLSAYYSPGVARPSQIIAAHPEKLRDYTWVNNLVAVVSDGSAVLGLGNIGPRAAMPVMEGKAMLFKHFADIDSVPIVLDVHTADEIVAAVQAIAPSFGAINLEDIAAPICFEVEERLKRELEIPVFHDDQHGTAIVTLAGLINATKVVGKQLSECRVVLIGAGAAGVAIAKLLHRYAKPAIIAVDSKGVISRSRRDLTPEKKILASFNELPYGGFKPRNLREVIRGADIVVGISKAGLLIGEDIAAMNKNPIVFALANPIPEITPKEARAAGAAVVATGRSDYPNQVNNALAYPGIFRGALDNGVTQITEAHKIAAAEAIAGLINDPTFNEVIPSVMNDQLVPAVAAVIR